MNIWRILLWKEFHEHKWKMLALTAIVLSVLIAGSIGNARDLFGLGAALYGYALIGPLYVAMGVSSGERSNRSMSFLNALPAPTWKAGVVRIFAGWLVLVTPLVATLLCCILQIVFTQNDPAAIHDPRDSGRGFLAGTSPHLTVIMMTIIVIDWCTSLYAWILLATVNQKTELRAGLIGLVVTAVLLVVSIWTGSHHDELTADNAHRSLTSTLMVATGSLLRIAAYDQVRGFADLFPWYVIIRASAIGVLLAIVALRYGQMPFLKPGMFSRREQANATSNVRLGPPLASPRSALMWMQYRQSAPIALCGLLITLLIAGIPPGGSRSEFLVFLGPFFGSVLALVVGTGAFVHQLEPGLHTFWRSRPISPKQWFWLKYSAGALVLVACYDLPIFVLQTVAAGPLPRLSVPILLHLFVYSAGVVAACGIRHPTYSAILAACAVLAVILPPLAFTGTPRMLAFVDMWEYSLRAPTFGHSLGYVLNGILLMGPLILCSTFLAAWLVKRDVSVSH